MLAVVVMACWLTDGDITDSSIEVIVSMNQTLARGIKFALWAGVVGANSGGDGMLLNDGDIIGSSIEVIVSMNQTLAWGSKLALWAGVVDVNCGGDGMLTNWWWHYCQ